MKPIANARMGHEIFIRFLKNLCFIYPELFEESCIELLDIAILRSHRSLILQRASIADASIDVFLMSSQETRFSISWIRRSYANRTRNYLRSSSTATFWQWNIRFASDNFFSQDSARFSSLESSLFCTPSLSLPLSLSLSFDLRDLSFSCYNRPVHFHVFREYTRDIIRLGALSAFLLRDRFDSRSRFRAPLSEITHYSASRDLAILENSFLFLLVTSPYSL